MSNRRLVVEPWYRDAFGRRQGVPQAVRDRIRALGHADEPAVDDAPEPVAVVRPGGRLPQPGEVTLEDGTALGRVERLPPDAPVGYHRLALDGRVQRLITGPGRCHLPDRPEWGWAVQLYAARSRDSWGIGDLHDLRRMAAWSATLGAGLLVVNPLHAPAPVSPIQASPYFPSTRRFRNPLYLRVERIPGAELLGDDLERLATAARALNERPLIDREPIFAHKMAALEAIWAARPELAGLEQYRAEQGAPLRQWATYATLAERHGANWTGWPEELRRPDSAAVDRFAAAHADRVAFHEWLQWLLDRQLAAAGAQMRLVQDVPIGVDREGADAWAWQDVLVLGATIGAPPDRFNQAGQDWGLPPFSPPRLRAAGYEPFIQTLRASLRHAGGLRIDHVLGLFRLWWLPLGDDPRHGAYVRYPADELLEIVALESARAKAPVIGEDLGTVEAGVRAELRRRRILSYRLAYFEKGPPSGYPRGSLAAVTTHDLPTIAGAWLGSDLEAQRRAGLDADARGLALLRRRLARAARISESAPLDEVVLAIHGALAASPSLFVTATLEDALRVEERPNLPGTIEQHPNWSIPLPRTLEEIEADEFVGRLAETLRRPAG